MTHKPEKYDTEWQNKLQKNAYNVPLIILNSKINKSKMYGLKMKTYGIQKSKGTVNPNFRTVVTSGKEKIGTGLQRNTIQKVKLHKNPQWWKWYSLSFFFSKLNGWMLRYRYLLQLLLYTIYIYIYYTLYIYTCYILL